jgi:hypothetical protein
MISLPWPATAPQATVEGPGGTRTRFRRTKPAQGTLGAGSGFRTAQQSGAPAVSLFEIVVQGPCSLRVGKTPCPEGPAGMAGKISLGALMKGAGTVNLPEGK